MAKYTTTIEAIQYTGYNFREVKEWIQENAIEEPDWYFYDDSNCPILDNKTSKTQLYEGDYLYESNGYIFAMLEADFITTFSIKQ